VGLLRTGEISKPGYGKTHADPPSPVPLAGLLFWAPIPPSVGWPLGDSEAGSTFVIFAGDVLWGRFSAPALVGRRGSVGLLPLPAPSGLRAGARAPERRSLHRASLRAQQTAPVPKRLPRLGACSQCEPLDTRPTLENSIWFDPPPE
jgi:hypothetical protein